MGSSSRIGELLEAVDVSAARRRVFTAAGVVVLIAIAVFVVLQSPFNPSSIRFPGAEASRYYYIGSQISEGIMPYRDSFDFHGPLIFIINAFGSFLNGTTGVWWLEIVFLAATLIVVFVTLNRCVGLVTSFIVCILFAGVVAYSLEGGNNVEEYGLLFQALGLAGFVDYCVRRQLTLASVYLIGTSAALAFCLRPLLAVYWIPFFLVVIVMVFRREGAVTGFTRTLSLLFSTLPTFVILIPWLSINNALTSCYDQVNLFYQDYVSLVTPQEQLDSLLYYINCAPFALILVISVAASIKLLYLKRKLRVEGETDGSGAVSLANATLADGSGAVSLANAGIANGVAITDDSVFTDDESPADDEIAAGESLAADETSEGTNKVKRKLFFGLPFAPPLVIKENPLMQHTEAFGSDTLLLILTNLAATLLAFATMAVPGRLDEPVFLHSLVCLVVPLAFVINLVVKGFSDRAPLKMAFGTVLIILLVFSFSVPGATTTLTRAQEQQTSSPELVEQLELVSLLENWQEDDEPTIVFGDECWVYTAIDSYSATRYAWQPFDDEFRPDLSADFYRQVGVADARLLIGRSDNGLIERYQGIDGYELVFKNERYEFYHKIGTVPSG